MEQGMESVGDILKREFPNGLPPTRSSREEIHRCQACLDSGRLLLGEVHHFCDCPAGEERKREAWLLDSGVPRARLGETLAAFKPLPGTEKALVAAHDFIAGTLCWLLIYGGVGNGKTHLAHGVALACLDRGRRVRFVNTLMLLTELRSQSGRPEFLTAMKELGWVPVLILDDFFWATDLEGRWLEEVVQRRYVEKQPLLVTSNRDLKQLSEPIVSRFLEMGRVVLNKGTDYRRLRPR